MGVELQEKRNSSFQMLHDGPQVDERAEERNTLGGIETIGDYLNLFGADLIRRLNEEYIPVHHPGKDEPLKILNEIKRPLFKAQAHVTTALLKGFKKQRRQLLIGEMGTGKTSMSIAVWFALAAELLNGCGRVIYMVPNHLTKKTKREIEHLLSKSVFEITYLHHFEDVLHLRNSRKFNRKPQKMEVYIIARDTAKLGYIYEPAAKWVDRTYFSEKKGYEKTHFQGWVCPDCGGQLMKEENDSLVPMEYDSFLNKHGKPTRRRYNLRCSNHVRLYKHPDPEQDEYRECGCALWQAKNKNKSSYSGKSRAMDGGAPRKVSPADLFKRYFKNKFDIAIGDECHELTGGSAQAHAFHVLMGCARYTLAMTGTLGNGYASNLFELFFRMFPKRMKDNGFVWGEVGRWIDLYGIRERVTKTKKEDTALNSSSNGSKRGSIKELPAAAPQLFTDMLSDVACFIQMSDMFEVLPKLSEGPMFVPMAGDRKFVSSSVRRERNPGQKKRTLTKIMRLVAPEWYMERSLSVVEKLLRRAVQNELENGGQSVLLGSLVNTLLSYPDIPFNFNGVYHPDTGREIVPPHYRLSERVLYPKELQLIKYVRARIKAGRKVAVFATFTGKLGTLQRLQQLLNERGIKTAVLDSNVKSAEREEWIEQREREGIQVLLCNPILVSTGLDLLSFSSLFFYQTGYRLTIVRQAGRRHWRIGQKNLCETVYCGYKNTMQELAINLMAAKMSAAMALEGQFSEEGLTALTDSSGGSLANELAKRFVGNKIEGVESAESIWGKMSIDASELIQINNQEPEILEAAEEIQVETYTGVTKEEVLSSWISATVPDDLHHRFHQQLDFVVAHIDKGIDGLSISQDLFLSTTELVWEPAKAPRREVEFRRWLFALTNMPVQPEEKVKEWQKEVHVITGSAREKTKKSLRVTEGQLAFNF
ncbi:DEAD/DEAH box helicase family protein [Paenibacillus sonchi]|uniref:DEAD/DEAH box helicase family protein n=1 Tax=Paenibacillus sonchi TaxID=373687 RepID=UPI0003084AF2|nr:DEAD/DEAH box helicase [Paenibacillus sonchi]